MIKKYELNGEICVTDDIHSKQVALKAKKQVKP